VKKQETSFELTTVIGVCFSAVGYKYISKDGSVKKVNVSFIVSKNQFNIVTEKNQLAKKLIEEKDLLPVFSYLCHHLKVNNQLPLSNSLVLMPEAYLAHLNQYLKLLDQLSNKDPDYEFDELMEDLFLLDKVFPKQSHFGEKQLVMFHHMLSQNTANISNYLLFAR